MWNLRERIAAGSFENGRRDQDDRGGEKDQAWTGQTLFDPTREKGGQCQNREDDSHSQTEICVHSSPKLAGTNVPQAEIPILSG